ncbi:MAG TPA: translesion error-prone DNA polymerase V autoproteolytic subunit [Candidatus Aphodousia faecigallinarum]|uniref:Translesion error-prone DNA polymerase V autoproteolytic subunit n=1 Tax=Candidatus Aphodousia faecigallinarum TaxID=2840677 RepID=A0A9D1IIX3_9BURK|nr:translesion error-prone DNA polymerase V autoproteolytic subunit [Candidatus Aphodousia faecigallinarum]
MTKGRGGKRDNAGRKPLGDETLSSTIIARVTPEQKETFKANGGGQWLRCSLTNLKESRQSIPAWAQAVMPVHHAAVPLFEYSVQAGFPSPAESYKETLDFNDLLIENAPATFVLRVSGQSMIDAGMCDGDLMVVDRSRTPKNNDIVVMQIDNDYTVKRFIKTSDGFYLKAENSSGLYHDIYPQEGQEWHLFGVVNFVIKALSGKALT